MPEQPQNPDPRPVMMRDRRAKLMLGKWSLRLRCPPCRWGLIVFLRLMTGHSSGLAQRWAEQAAPDAGVPEAENVHCCICCARILPGKSQKDLSNCDRFASSRL